uniref:(northern house mosquito) hypothetical protein n=1 Tax=Culex pipiens TaxID=7175 RepID=A0A8D8E3B4_CULPI
MRSNRWQSMPNLVSRWHVKILRSCRKSVKTPANHAKVGVVHWPRKGCIWCLKINANGTRCTTCRMCLQFWRRSGPGRTCWSLATLRTVSTVAPTAWRFSSISAPSRSSSTTPSGAAR